MEPTLCRFLHGTSILPSQFFGDPNVRIQWVWVPQSHQIAMSVPEKIAIHLALPSPRYIQLISIPMTAWTPFSGPNFSHLEWKNPLNHCMQWKLWELIQKLCSRDHLVEVFFEESRCGLEKYIWILWKMECTCVEQWKISVMLFPYSGINVCQV